MAKSDKALLNCENLSKQYGYFFALKKISFQVNENTVFGIAGANGAGKTTLIKILSGLLKPTYGKIMLNGLNYEENAKIIRQNIGITTDESFLFEELTIFENLKYYANLHLNFDIKEIETKIDEYCDKFNLKDWINEPIRILSHGMKQKVEIIRVLIHEPSILFLDEPFSGLDYNATSMLIDFFKKLHNRKNISIILTTHKIDVYQQICDEILILKQGKINKTITREEFNETKIKSYF
ncbi:MAG: ABC transporter ATP-binding protein [Candidatus Heimdallarchaeota archaeon]